ncbi:unnamed protein product [Schistosoma curassoni]|uniref:CCDC34 domain-containing protein n=1 Tax=Schistosoma curassoni TaxID=6186 RepID=A0A183JER0_9TREM|nr:unnamed protein product [Schistosoma curassoni]
MAIRQIKNGKAAGSDNIPTEALKADVAVTARIFHILFSKTQAAYTEANKSTRKQNKTVLDTDYHTVNLRRKVSTKQFTTTDSTSNEQTYNRSSSKVSPHSGGSPTSDLYDITECLISECVRDHLLIKPVISKNDHNVTISSKSDVVNNAKCLHNSNDKLSAWGCWLLEKEKQRREQKRESKKKQIEEIQKRNQLLVQKINRRRLVEQKCKEWTEAKQKERIQIKKLREIEKKNEESKKLQELLEHLREQNSIKIIHLSYKSSPPSQKALTSTCQEVLGSKKHHYKEWISMETLEKIQERKNKKTAIDNSRTRAEKVKTQAAYTEANNSILKGLRFCFVLTQTQKSKLKYQEWCKKKTEEEYKKIDYIKQIEFKKHKANQTRKEASTVAYDHWLKSIGCKKSASHYSHGYSDGKLIDYYDRTANPSPSFVNPNPWINSTDLTLQS